MTSGDRDDYAIYSRPKSPSEPPMSSLMTTSCPPAAFLTSEFQTWSSNQNGTNRKSDDIDIGKNVKSGSIYSNENFAPPRPSAPTTTTTTTTSTSLFNFTSMTSLPPRPPSFRLRSRDSLLSGGSPSHHHPHYNHHFRDSGHASLGSSDDISSAPPLPPRLSCKIVIKFFV
jgi:hypothetical protein